VGGGKGKVHISPKPDEVPAWACTCKCLHCQEPQTYFYGYGTKVGQESRWLCLRSYSRR